MEYLYKLDYPNIAKRIKKLRKSADLTQAELAEKINISTNAVAKCILIWFWTVSFKNCHAKIKNFWFIWLMVWNFIMTLRNDRKIYLAKKKKGSL